MITGESLLKSRYINQSSSELASENSQIIGQSLMIKHSKHSIRNDSDELEWLEYQKEWCSRLEFIEET